MLHLEYMYGNLTLNPQVSLVIPERVMKEHGASNEEIGESRNETLRVSIRDIRLVQRIGNRDVIVDRMDIPESNWDEDEGETPLARLIPSTNLEIETPEPLPESKDDESNPEYLISDTYRNEVENVTFEPVLATPPFYPSIIDELRNKYSKFRRRHTDDFIEKMIAIDAKSNLKKGSAELMTTPTKDLFRKQKAQSKAIAKKQVLTDETLNILGTYMQRKLDSPSSSPKQSARA
jgi:large subunit ribosomal protein L24